ncbi:MAG TPA: hypothetical protein P5121_18315, partial [Caldilineaceae bacterium]|nr:hypothetical protein [Caldilineaceae bacterium]
MLTIVTATQPKRERFTMADLIVHVALLLLGLIIAMPILIAFFTSFKPPAQVVTFPPSLFPSEWTVENYIVAWQKTPFGRYLLNSLIQSGVITAAQVVTSILAAYAFSVLIFP